ncbi:MAG: SDR family oxidoreductase [Steroidobacteraceae bacterium]|jgi:uncharacterized protein YbjT (DUF2867 family)|nr:SDR family oxidoreductase [Steroidobacteraceae bacterium]
MSHHKLFALFLVSATLLGCATTRDAGPKTAVVIGGGQSGAPLARILKSQGYEVRVMVRDPSRVKGLPDGVQVVAGDVTNAASLAAGLKGADYVLSTIGANCVPRKPFAEGGSPADVDYRGIEKLAAASKAAGVRQLVLMSSLGAGDADPKAALNAMCGMVLEWKGRGEASLRASGVPYTIVRPGGLKPFPGQPECSEGKEPLALYSAKESRGPGTVCRADVGLVMAGALGNPAALGKTVNLTADKQLPLEGWRAAWAAIPRD